MRLIKSIKIGLSGCLTVAFIMIIVFLLEGAMATDRVRTQEFKDIRSFDITAVTGSVDIKTHNMDKVIVISENNMEVSEKVSLEITETEGHLTIKEILHDNDAKGETALRIFLPGAGPYQSIECISAKGHITFQGFEVESLKAHAASMPIQVNSVHANELTLTTASTAITLVDCEITKYGKLVTSGGVIGIDLPNLPSTELHVASTSGEVRLRVPTFGDSFQLILSRNEDMGKIISPFECVESITRRLHDNDTYRTNRCTIDRGSGGPKVDLLTASGTIRVLSESMYENQREKSVRH